MRKKHIVGVIDQASIRTTVRANKNKITIGSDNYETASIAYTGELLPAGTASYGGIAIDTNKRYLKNSGKDKTPALVESGQGKFFNGTNQYINTGATPNDSEGTFISRFTYASGAIQKIMAGVNYSNNRCYMGINASGKIGVGFGANTYDTLFSPDVLVAGRSYHVVFRYSGGTYWLFVDSALKATGTITGLTTFAGTSFFIGALNNNGTPSNYFNNVIDETYYYDVALTDAQIEALYKYPEKVKAYNGAIVPDIGNEANCKLFLPMCENSESNVYNVAVNPATALALVNYTTAMHTSATKLSYGAQCTAWKRDSLGVLLGMSNGINTMRDNINKSLNIPMLDTELGTQFVISFVIKRKALAYNDAIVFTYLASKGIQIYTNRSYGSTTMTFAVYNGTGTDGISALVDEQAHFIECEYNNTLMTMRIDGVVVGTKTFTFMPSGLSLGATTTTLLPNGIISAFKIHNGMRYANYNKTKELLNAQKIIAKLGA